MKSGSTKPDRTNACRLAGESQGHRAYRVARLQLLPQTENVFLMYQDGWNPPESATGNSSVEWQWTKKDATLKFRNPKRTAIFYLHADGQPAGFDIPQTVNVYLRDQVIDTFQIASTEAMVRKVPLKAEQFGTDDMVQIRIECRQDVHSLAEDARQPRFAGARHPGLPRVRRASIIGLPMARLGFRPRFVGWSPRVVHCPL